MTDEMFLYVGAYEDEASAETDYQALKDLHSQGMIGSYDVGVVVKNDEGKLDVKRHTDSTGKGAWTGLAVGALLGVIFPPSILVSGAIGAGAGAAIGHSFNEISKDDMKDIGDFLAENQAALVVIGEVKSKEVVKQATKQAIKDYFKDFSADKDELEANLKDQKEE